VFTCNICGASSPIEADTFDREIPSCKGCGSNVRWRSVILALSDGLFEQSLVLEQFPERRDIAGAGLSDSTVYADRLAAKFDYRNTQFFGEPRLDITDPPDELLGTLDFLIASDVFEHVEPPVERAFKCSFSLLKPGGLFVLTTPYTHEDETREHFPSLNEYKVVYFKGAPIVVNRAVDGSWEVFENPVLHGGLGATLEMRSFARQSLIDHMEAAGFTGIAVNDEPRIEFGISWPMPFGAPIVGRRPA
jgi:SAM-dependent methyltransferase